jgi:hypothetical protein
MGDKQSGEQEVRKIQTTGQDGDGCMITLPKELVENLGWRKAQKVTMEPYGQGLIVRDWQA